MAREFTLVAHALRNLRRRPTRTGILVVAIGLLVAVFVFALSFVRRVDSSIRKTADRLGADVLVVPTGSRGAAEDVLLDHRVKTFYMDRSLVDRVKAIPGIEKVTTQTYLATITGACCDVPESIVVAFDPKSDFIVSPWMGENSKRKLARGEAIVGSDSALNIGFGLTNVDGVLFGNVFKMVGVLEHTGTGLDTAIFIDEQNLDAILRSGKVNVRPGSISVIFAKVAKGHDPAEVAAAIDDSIIEVDAVARRDVGQNLIRALADISRMFIVTFALASLLAALLTWAVFSGIANERAREVGLMRAIGARESHVVKLFALEVLMVGALGSVVGIASGTALGIGLASEFTILHNVSTDLGLVDRLGVGLTGLVVGVSICVVGALAPIRRAGRTDPSVVLKGE